MAQDGPTWGQDGGNMGHDGARLAHLSATLAHLGATVANLGVRLEHRWRKKEVEYQYLLVEFWLEDFFHRWRHFDFY